MRRKRKTHRRGRTRPTRLKLIDQLFEAGLLSLPQSESPLAVDLGYGDEIVTTVQWARALVDQSKPAMRVVGVECEASRVQNALKQEIPQELLLEFKQGGFDLREAGLGEALVVRAFNVLRGYGPEQVQGSQIEMLQALVPGGLLIEGSSDTEGHLLCAHLWRREQGSPGDLFYQGLLIATDFTRGFSPRMFRDVLPRDLRRNYHPGEPVFEWLEHFERLTTVNRVSGRDNHQVFSIAAEKLAQSREDTQAESSWLERGALLWTPRRPSLRPEVLAPGTLPKNVGIAD